MAECDVCIGGYPEDGESSDLFNQEERTSRKDRVCEQCQLPIVRGQRYQHTAAKWDGEFSAYNECLLCVEIRDVFSCDNGVIYGNNFWDDMRELAFPNLTTASPCFSTLSAAAKQFVLDRWSEWKFKQKMV